MTKISLTALEQATTFPPAVHDWLQVLGDAIVATETQALGAGTILADTPYKRLLVRGVARDIRSLKGIYVLLRLELIPQAAALVRVLCESLITFRFVAVDPQIRAGRFEEYGLIEEYRFTEALLQAERERTSPVYLRELEAHLAQIQVEYRELLPTYSHVDEKGKRQIYRTWSGKKIAELAEDPNVALGRFYKAVYKQMSAYIHGTSWSLRREHAYYANNYDSKIVLVDVATIVRNTIGVWVEWGKFCQQELGWQLVPVCARLIERIDELDRITR